MKYQYSSMTVSFRLNRRLEALSMTKYGSVDSGLNRAHLAPNTNIHAVEGSNPIYNTAVRNPDFDAIRHVPRHPLHSFFHYFSFLFKA
jgi:hypothetical protein